MTDRRYSEDEVAEIFRRATETAVRGRGQLPTGDGMTLAQLQDIGREVGIAPDQVRQAAVALDRPPQMSQRRVLGIPIGVSRTVELGRELNDDEWERLVVDLRQTFDAKGTLSRDGSLRQWTNGNLHIYLEPGEHGHRLRMRTLNESLMLGALAGSFLSAFFLLITAAVAAKRGMDIGRLAVPGVMSLGAAALASASLLRLPGWARQRLTQMEGVAARLLSGRTAPPDDPAQ
jgi:hypothetical protein